MRGCALSLAREPLFFYRWQFWRFFLKVSGVLAAGVLVDCLGLI
nr:MAG TPA: hypothetical protein [Caudoviricetes sp.]